MLNPIRKTLVAASFAVASLSITARISSNKSTELTKSATASVLPAPSPVPAPAPSPAASVNDDVLDASTIYSDMNLAAAGLNANAFDLALKGFEKLDAQGKIANDEIITIVDFSQPSTKKRLYVIDLKEKEILFQSVVSHGRNTGTLWAKSFSNATGSYKSSPGFYVTAETYMGGNGYSLRLDGQERNINHSARSRAIVMHGATYANEATIKSLGFLGRSQGCPALPVSLTRPVINKIKGGTCLFIYTNDRNYLANSSLV